MTTFIVLAVGWILLSVLVVVFASMASARFTHLGEEPLEARRRSGFQRKPQEVPNAPGLGRTPVQN